METEDVLYYVTTTLVQRSRYHSCLKALFALEKGDWKEIRALCKEMDDLIESHKLDPSLELYVSWSPFPQSTYSSGYAIITFFCEALHWSNIALYNKQALLDGLI